MPPKAQQEIDMEEEEATMELAPKDLDDKSLRTFMNFFQTLSEVRGQSDRVGANWRQPQFDCFHLTAGNFTHFALTYAHYRTRMLFVSLTGRYVVSCQSERSGVPK